MDTNCHALQRSETNAAAPKPDADSPGLHGVGEGAAHLATGQEPADLPAADVGLRLLGIALHLIQGGDEDDAIRTGARRLLSLLDADEQPTAIAADIEPGVHPHQHRVDPPTTATSSTTSAPASATGSVRLLSRRRPAPATTHHTERTPRVAIWCFGGFRMAIGHRTVDWMTIRPRARAAMRLLALHAGRPVHREALIEALWPDAPPASATANLQVAISSLRGLLEPDRERRKPQLVVRTGDAYLLNLPADAYVDTLAFQSALTGSRQAGAVGDTATAVDGLRDALASYTGDLLPEDGPAEWLQQDREMYRRQAANAAAELATAELAAGSPREAVAAAEKCLVIDGFHDTGWQLLVRAYQRIGAPAAAERARRRYSAMLAELGIDTDGPGLSGAW
ncbi:BTAD domain-containing putative transcriptional regulator [Streptomyces sioyaensis]|uniref:AfsR/SARP family transcriptional regulator n=1 Tax=Streptomyces sioyaensis TaxID=67364 RepID=UPI003720E93E